jgi:hypothetical protein
MRALVSHSHTRMIRRPQAMGTVAGARAGDRPAASEGSAAAAPPKPQSKPRLASAAPIPMSPSLTDDDEAESEAADRHAADGRDGDVVMSVVSNGPAERPQQQPPKAAQDEPSGKDSKDDITSLAAGRARVRAVLILLSFAQCHALQRSTAGTRSRPGFVEVRTCAGIVSHSVLLSQTTDVDMDDVRDRSPPAKEDVVCCVLLCAD